MMGGAGRGGGGGGMTTSLSLPHVPPTRRLLGHGWLGASARAHSARGGGDAATTPRARLTPASHAPLAPCAGCSREYMVPEQINWDFGVPTELCHETAPNSQVFTRDWTKATVQMDCNSWTPTLTLKDE